MFISCKLDRMAVTSSGSEVYIYKLIDSRFIREIMSNNDDMPSLVIEIIKYYESRKLNVSDAIARLYLHKYKHQKTSKGLLLRSIILNSDDINYMAPNLNYHKYSQCIKNKIITQCWVKCIKDV